MDRNQQMIGGVQDDNASVQSMESVVGRSIPTLQGAVLPGEELYMFAEKEIR